MERAQVVALDLSVFVGKWAVAGFCERHQPHARCHPEEEWATFLQLNDPIVLRQRPERPFLEGCYEVSDANGGLMDRSFFVRLGNRGRRIELR